MITDDGGGGSGGSCRTRTQQCDTHRSVCIYYTLQFLYIYIEI